jgi:CubicO group peptidase (beta-lactamase class C family)
MMGAWMIAASTPLSFSQQPDLPELCRQFTDLIGKEQKPGDPGGVALVAMKGRIIYTNAFGLANLELDVPMRPNTVFNIGSMTKQFTAVAVMQLVEQGKISLHDDLSNYLPDYPRHDVPITIEQLLSHTAGIAASPPDALTALHGRKDYVPLSDIIATFRNRPPELTPGSKWSYSNNGYMLLGAIIEKVSGLKYPEFLEKNIFIPSGMTNTLFGDDAKIVKNRASSYLYSRSESTFLNARNDKTETAGAAGGIQSTALDLFKWHMALGSGRLLKRSSLELAQTERKLPNGDRTHYGFGWFIGNLQGSPIFEHGGNMGGFMSHAIYLPREDIYVVVLYNFRSQRLPEYLAGDLAAAAMGKPFHFVEIPVSSESLQPYVGVYEDEGIERSLTVENGKLMYQRTGGNKMTMHPYARDRFFF